MSAADLATRLQAGLAELGLELTPAQQTQLLDYLALIQKWNKVYNLTAVRDLDEMFRLHLLDSLAAVGPLRRHAAGRPLRLLDVGSGGGLPGVVFAICCPELTVDCVDTVGKKAAFIQQVAAELRKNIDQTVASLLSQLDVNVREIVRDAVAEKLRHPRDPSA